MPTKRLQHYLPEIQLINVTLHIMNAEKNTTASYENQADRFIAVSISSHEAKALQKLSCLWPNMIGGYMTA